MLCAAGAAFFLGACAPVAYVVEPSAAYVQGPPPAPYPEATEQQTAASPLDQLMAPVALYPDPLISLILPASTFPSDVAAAGDYLEGGGSPVQADSQPWDQSVRSLAHYPEVVKWMAQNVPWTQAVGAAFVSQPADVMNAIQRLRELARAAGTLTDNDEQRVFVQGSYVEIEPAQPDVIYVPRYDPAVVFVDQPYYGYNGPFFAYGPAYGAGAWLTFGCNWHGGGILVVGPDYWHGRGGWWHPDGEGRGRGEFGASANLNVNVNVRAWSFPANRPRPQAPGGWQGQAQIVHPRLAAGSPAQPPQPAFRNIQTRGPAAVVAVAGNPAAFKGKPINNAIIARSPESPARSGAPLVRPAVRPQAPAAVPARQAPIPPRRVESNQAANPVRIPGSTPVAAAEKGQAEHATNPAAGKAPKKAAPKKIAKPAAKEEKPKERQPAQ